MHPMRKRIDACGLKVGWARYEPIRPIHDGDIQFAHGKWRRMAMTKEKEDG
jgi:hypothetical protein